VISNHTSYADGVLLALACRRMGRSLRLLATSGVFNAPVLGTVDLAGPIAQRDRDGADCPAAEGASFIAKPGASRKVG
jgi:1-acyl-sn-glycerol-3-phosphate acyltransferase